jgi:hypothetical protein
LELSAMGKRNMRISLVVLVILWIMLMIGSCTSDNQSPLLVAPGIDVKEKNWNTAFRLRDDPAFANTHKNGETLFLRVENLSKETIIFPDDFGVKLFITDDQEWIGVQNNVYYTGPNYLPVKSEYPLGLVINVLPYVPNLASPRSIRVIVVGYAQDNNKEILGAYLDVPLNP